MAYQYRVNFEHHTQVTSDPYSIATTADGMRTAILSRADRQFDWGPQKRSRCDSLALGQSLSSSDL